MKYTVINGCDYSTSMQIKAVEKIKEIIGIHTTKINSQWIELSEYKLNYCMGCDYCQNVNPGLCAIDDGQNEILRKYINSDSVLIVTPIHFGCCNSITKNFIDRTEPFFLPYQVLKKGKSIMKERYDKYPELVFIGVIDSEKNDYANKFSEFVKECNLAAASPKVRIKTITNKTDIDCLSDYII